MRDIKQFVLTTFSGFCSSHFYLFIFFCFFFVLVALIIFVYICLHYICQKTGSLFALISFRLFLFILPFFRHYAFIFVYFFNTANHTLGQRSTVLLLFVSLTFSSFCDIISYPCGNCSHYLLTFLLFGIKYKYIFILYMYICVFHGTLTYVCLISICI